ncbi:hypothetical protein MMC31_001676 [Peltigera leucophlebia]|nr:hypothetical protein [Peltigera leucophlebia]
MQRLTLFQFLSGLLLTAAFPQHTSSSRHRRDLQILTPPIDQSPTRLYPSLSEPYTLAANQFDPPPDFLLSSSFPPDTSFSKNNPPTILNPEPSIDTTYCTDKKVLVCCPQQNSDKYKIPDDGFLPEDCRLAAQYGVEFGKYPCRCCGGFFGALEALGGKPLGSNCVDLTYDAEGSGGSSGEGSGRGVDEGRGENEGFWD